MSNDPYFVPKNILPNGFAYPNGYCELVEKKSNGAAMLNMPPWVFASNELWAMEESEKVFGRKLIPFAQAENLDMVAYFEVSESERPAVWLANPWANSADTLVYNKFDSFEDWLNFSLELSNNFLIENPSYKERKFWFPDAK